ncbi:MAG: hypothetical protein MUP98_02530 [Candidatus Aminicenantes bacterium]|nr:hypothetical protein [Candidatus Aminicenantes bacterium]
MTDDVKNRIKDAATEIEGKKKLPCKRAFQLAEELRISLKDIGDICNTEGIKIIHCQLGCFS